MSRLLALVTFAAVAQPCAAGCFLTNDVIGQDAFQKNNEAYLNCKKGIINASVRVAVTPQALCTCAENQWLQARDCTYAWMQPWLQTVHRDKVKFCGSSSASSASSLSGSDQSLPSSQSSIDWSSGSSSGTKSTSSTQQFTLAQKCLFVGLGVCGCLCCVGVIGGLFAMSKGTFKGKKTKPQYYGDDDQDYEQQQYDQGYPGDDQGYPATGGEQDYGDMPVMDQQPLSPQGY